MNKAGRATRAVETNVDEHGAIEMILRTESVAALLTANSTNSSTNKSGKVGQTAFRSVQQRLDLRSVPLHYTTLQSGDNCTILRQLAFSNPRTQGPVPQHRRSKCYYPGYGKPFFL